MSDRRPARLSALRDSLHRASLDALLVTSLPNVRYLTGFSGTSALLLVAPADALLLTDFRYATQVAEEVGDLARVSVQPQSLWSGLWSTLPTMAGVTTIGFESATLVHRDFQRLLEQGKRWQWRPVSELVERLREVKDPGEVASIAAAAQLAVAALESTLPQLRAGLTELGVAGILERELRKQGSEGFPFPTIVASGPRSALPHAGTSTRELSRGDMLLMDFGAILDGYCADVTRTCCVGRSSERQRELHSIVVEANERARAGIRPGMTGRDADALARDYIDLRGHGPLFGHSLGHGLGLEVHEAPRLARTASSVLREGVVVTIEPGIYVPDWGGIRVEDDVLLESEGARLLTNFTRELLELN